MLCLDKDCCLNRILNSLCLLSAYFTLHHSIIDNWGLDLRHDELHMANKLDFMFLKLPRDSDAHTDWLKKEDAEKSSSSHSLCDLFCTWRCFVNAGYRTYFERFIHAFHILVLFFELVIINHNLFFQWKILFSDDMLDFSNHLVCLN